MTWWVETFLNCVQDYYSLWVLVKTNQTDHLFLSWGYHHPAREPILVLVRGVHKQCGYRYIWDTPTIVEQDTAGDTLVHQFHLLSLQAPSHIWFYIWAPNGPYGLEIQSPLHRADLSPVLVPPCNPLWLFDTSLLPWVRDSGTVAWENDGYPNPGCFQLGGTATSGARSPMFDSSWASRMDIEFYSKKTNVGSGFISLDIRKSGLWNNVKNWWEPLHDWTLRLAPNMEAFTSPLTQLRIRKTLSHIWRVDTVCVRLYP